MFYSESQEKGPWGNILPTNLTEAFKVMIQGFDVYNKFINASLDFLELTSKGKSEDIISKWTDLTSNLYKDYFKDYWEIFPSPMKVFTSSPFREKISWENPFNAWRQLLNKAPFGVKAPFEEIEDYIKFAKDWQEKYTKLYNSWVNYLEKTANAAKLSAEGGGLPDKIFLTYVESTEDFINDWLSFLAEHTKAHFKLLKSSMAARGKESE
jgi:hypothetical protein